MISERLAHEIIDKLSQRHESIATAESITGGLISAALTDIPGSSKVFRGGVVAYSLEMKKLELDIPLSEIKKVGVVSEAIAVVQVFQLE